MVLWTCFNSLEFKYLKARGRPKITFIEAIKKDMSFKEVLESMTSGRIQWKKRIHVTDPN